MEKEITGYPHIDKPWMKYYTEEQKELIIPNMNVSEYVKERNKNNLSGIQEVYYGREFTYQESFYRNELAAKALSDIGVKKGDVVGMLLPNIPEAGQLWFGATELGAVSDFIDPRPDSMNVETNSKKILEVLKYEKVKYIVALDMCYLSMLLPIENELKELGIDTIITVSAEDSMTLDGKLDYLEDIAKYNKLNNLRNPKQQLEDYKAILNKIKFMEETNALFDNAIKKSDLKIYKYKDLIRECENSKYNSVSDVNAVNYIGHTSGTSGSRPKPIVITNKNGISSAIQCEKSGFTPKFGESAFNLLPFFAPAGAYSNYLAYLTAGVKMIDVSEFVIPDFGYLIKKYKPTSLLATPTWYNFLPTYKLLDDEDLSYLNKIIFVGDSMSLSDQEKVQKWLKEHNSPAKIVSAHGMSEYIGCGSFANDLIYKKDSIGIPLPNTIYSIVDPNIEDKLVPLKFNENEDRLVGELIVSSSSVTNGKLFDDIIIPHYELDGNSYIRTRDLVEMDRDGFFYHKDRKDRSFCRVDGYKVIPYKIEEVIENNKYVKQAKIVGYMDERTSGLMPVCHVVLKEEYKDLEDLEVVNDIVYNSIISNPNMSSRQIPSKFKIRDEMPMTKNNKINFNYLTNEVFSGDEVNVDVEENNLVVGDIKIYKNCKVLKKK